MTDLTLTQDANMTELALVPNDPAFADQEIAFVESLNQTCDNVSLWSESGSAGWRDFWEHCPFTLIRENGRAQDRGFSVTGTMLTAVLGSYKLKHPETFKAFLSDFYTQLKAAHEDAGGGRARVTKHPAQMFGPALRVMAPVWFIIKIMPILPQQGSSYKHLIYLKKDHPCVLQQDPGFALFNKACAALNSCTKEDEQTLHVSGHLGAHSVILDGYDSFKCKVPRYPVHGVGNNSVILDGYDSFKCKVPRYPVYGVGNNGGNNGNDAV
jgi:hypothetical protein